MVYVYTRSLRWIQFQSCLIQSLYYIKPKSNFITLFQSARFKIQCQTTYHEILTSLKCITFILNILQNAYLTRYDEKLRTITQLRAYFFPTRVQHKFKKTKETKICICISTDDHCRATDLTNLQITNLDNISTPLHYIFSFLRP